MANKIVKLGEKASFFFDPTTRIQISVGEVVELTKASQYSKKIKKALNGGHLVQTSEEELEAFKNGTLISNRESEEDTNWLESFDPTDSKAVNKLKVDQLKELIKFISDEEYEDDYFDDMKKVELITELEEVLNS